MLVLHANWSSGALRLWAESLKAYLDAAHPALVHAAPAEIAAASRDPRERSASFERTPTCCDVEQASHASDGEAHRYVIPASDLLATLTHAGVLDGTTAQPPTPATLRLRLPRDAWGPLPSDRLSRLAGALDLPVEAFLGDFQVQCLTIPNELALKVLQRLDESRDRRAFECDQGLRYWISVGGFILDLLADQRFVPTLTQARGGGMQALWQPWLHDDQARRAVGALLTAMPPVVRAAVDEHQGQPWSILSDALRTLTDAAVRAVLVQEQFIEAIDGRDPATDAHVAWLSGLLDRSDRIASAGDLELTLQRDVALWISRLDETGQDQPLRLCLKLNEPVLPAASGNDDRTDVAKADNADQSAAWRLSLHLQSTDNPELQIDAEEVWSRSISASGVGAPRVEHPQELLLAELARAARLYPKIEAALSEQAPTEILLSTAEAYEFLRDVRPVLEESGFGVIVPAWWNQPIGRLGVRLRIETPDLQSTTTHADGIAPTASTMGLNSLVRFQWQLAIGDQLLSRSEFEALMRQASPLAHVRGRWIEINPEQLKEASEFLARQSEDQMTLLEAIQLAHGASDRRIALPVFGLDASGWAADVLNASGPDHRMPMVQQPKGFAGELRPYQKTGLSWLSFMDQFGLGVCLADDMGLGKTIQLIAMLLHEREAAAAAPEALKEQASAAKSHDAQLSDVSHLKLNARVGPTLLIVPTSVVSNWVRELARFAPTLRAHVHHGPNRPLGDQAVRFAMNRDIVITTYPLVSRDFETLKRVRWHRVVLDEAQYIKNPPTKQTTAIRSLHAPRRVALTGTPVENRLSELWSIMEFCNPGYLGAAGEFRRRFAVPIERHRDRRQAERLRQMVRPFVLRRVKTDPNVIDDLPQCLETKEYATLTPEQATLYQQLVDRMLAEVDRAQGMQRRGLVLATLVRLKQICNHPAQYLDAQSSAAMRNGNGPDIDADALDAGHPVVPSNGAPLSSRSGKVRRLMTLLEEILAAGDKALIFTQFRQMGHLLTAMIQNDLDAEALFLHGGTPAAKRQQLIDRFQSPDGSSPIFVLSLKAGGLGLNLTAANHVFHFDRWWNPAVESQATDRAFRIGQTRNVHVHKFVCVGTLEERIDQMIEQKTELAQHIIGSGEQWLTELSTGQLHELLTLRQSALESES